MTKTVEFILDLAAPNGYLAWYPLKEIAAKTGAELVVTPVFLGGMHKMTGNSPPMMRDADVKGKVPYAALEFQRFLDRHEMDRFKIHPALPFNSIMLQRILCAAENQAEMQALVDALQPAVWERNIDCSDADAVRSVLEDAGFDAERLLAATQDPDVKQLLADNTEHAVERGAFGIPTFFVGDEMWFGKERLGQIEEYLAGGKP
ncbi:2-hydroxychromene-2-carboxylate isomerase [Qipengyuania psychrotolerans]|uniref:2-hydroxychromene-2-carboxylate isomerase n=1 Tax=Qipengyuania psychrotolerans TaxID=2867238 RepID=A0ABX8ZJR2_9SPHN|nr:2-hydroxychromene-2-carboxylate isomerase [Qipengyuania psychrotolerans]QZD87929.1 2-hydroxychromene-2-carboxylate isomerase [Qipengyuania psychrotolerans]